MKRTKQSIIFTLPQMSWLQRRAKELGISVSDLVRRIVDEKREGDG
jgi:hypothetical protein